MAALRYNPFTPGKRLTRPALFAGRSAELEAGLRLLVQATEGNARHGIITGVRGIGKSSLSSQIQGLARSEPEYLKLVGLTTDEFGRELMVAEYIAQASDSVSDLASGLMRALSRATGQKRWPKLSQIQLDLKLVKANFGPGEPTENVVESFVDDLERAWSRLRGRVEGILLVIDEIDRVAETAGVPTFFKVATEMLTARGLENVALLPVGMVGVLERLKAEHASVGRVFDVIHVPQLERHESMEIVRRALSGTGVSIDEDTNGVIATLSGGLPHPVHLLGSECFNADTDGIITSSDLSKALRAVTMGKWKEDFDAGLLQAGSGKNREILRVMADYERWTVPLQYICSTLGVTQPQISGNLNTLMKRDVIVRTDRGMYRFKEPLFGIYVGMMNASGKEPVEHRPRKRKAKQS